MRNHRRTALAAAPLSLALLLAGACSDDDPADDATTTTTTEATTSSSDTTASTEPTTTEPTTAPRPSSETTTPPPTEDESEAGEPLPTDRQEWASELIRAWGAGDRERAAELATPEAVDTLFGYLDPGGDDWKLERCEGAAGTVYCTFSSASLAQSVRTQQGAPTNVLAPISRVTVMP